MITKGRNNSFAIGDIRGGGTSCYRNGYHAYCYHAKGVGSAHATDYSNFMNYIDDYVQKSSILN